MSWWAWARQEHQPWGILSATQTSFSRFWRLEVQSQGGWILFPERFPGWASSGVLWCWIVGSAPEDANPMLVSYSQPHPVPESHLKTPSRCVCVWWLNFHLSVLKGHARSVRKTSPDVLTCLLLRSKVGLPLGLQVAVSGSSSTSPRPRILAGARVSWGWGPLLGHPCGSGHGGVMLESASLLAWVPPRRARPSPRKRPEQHVAQT